MTPIPDHEVRSELDRILASKGFAGAGRLSKLLRYAVERTLAGETDQLKEYSVGIEVFERDQNYDPRLDSIVRVEAGRLRSRLDDYYNGDGASSTIRIGLPRGGYSAHFERKGESPVAAATTVPATPPRRSLVAAPLAIALICAIGGMVVWLAAWNRQPAGDPRPSIAVLAFESNMLGDDNVALARRMTEAVTSELARLGTVSVASYTSAQQFSGRRRPIREIAAALSTRYIVEASMDDEGDQVLFVARLVNADADRKVWVSDYRGTRDDIRGMAQRMAFDISAELLKHAP